ncbi:unnamed protein product [Bursaphelenchus xylophilus]|nr:unnamed protein product [Bursaphelenchus xylophilus]CAG9104612.1 unnamed protein product [Bursaphelenchus xylophilus]
MWLQLAGLALLSVLGTSLVPPRFFKPDDEGEIYAVIAVGSHQMINYRHQADGCHTYHVLRNHGVKEENIIVMMVDDIASNPENPFPGKVFNHRNLTTDVYAGCKIDYRSWNVSSQNFMNVMTGVETHIGPVLRSTEKDKVFVFYADHGGYGHVQFPDIDFNVQDLNNTLAKMTEKRMYKELVLYVSACYSGSLVENVVPLYENVYAVTAANNNERSWAEYCDNKSGICLSDEFTSAFLEFSDANDLHNSSLEEQYQAVKKRVYCSHVMQYGNKKIAGEEIAEFLGEEKAPLVDAGPYHGEHECERHPDDGVRITDPTLHYMRTKLLRLKKNNDAEKAAKMRAEIGELLERRQLVDKDIQSFVEKVATTDELKELLAKFKPITDFECHHKVLRYFSRNCYSLAKNPYLGKSMYKIVNLCHAMSAEEIIGHLKSHFQEKRNVSVL